MRLPEEVLAGPVPRRLYRSSGYPHHGIYPAAFELRRAGRDRDAGLRISTREDELNLARYVAALDEALGPDWLERWEGAPCSVDVALRCGSPARLALPCLQLSCPLNLLGHVEWWGPDCLVVLYRSGSVAGRLCCVRQVEPDPSLDTVGQSLGGLDRERTRQIEEVALRRAGLAYRRLWRASIRGE